jgi:uncharacterized damage-inducible protein DinB
MSLAQSLLPEFDHEMATTRRALERVPLDKASWRPHAKSYTLGELANHLAQIPGWTEPTLTRDSLDMSPEAGDFLPPPVAETRKALLASFDENLAQARKALAETSDEAFFQPWTLKTGDTEHFTMPRIAVFRSFILSHIIHHRAQLGVYLRLNDVPVPSSYGPTADEQGM